MKDKTKRIKCFGCEHISFHFLLLVANNSPMFGVGGMSRETFMQKYHSGVCRGPGQSEGTPSTFPEHPSNFLFPEMLAGEDVLPLGARTEPSWRK